MRIFYAEDDRMAQKAVAYALIRMGHEVTTVDNGKEAIHELSKEKFDFIILDVFMPHVSGMDVAKYIREELEDSTPIIIISRNGNDDLMAQAKSIGVNDYIAKPFEPDVLLLKLKKFTGNAAGSN